MSGVLGPAGAEPGRCSGCRGLRWLIGPEHRLCEDCTALAAADAARYCTGCGLPLDGSPHACDRPGERAYCRRDGFWLGTHRACAAAVS